MKMTTQDQTKRQSRRYEAPKVEILDVEIAQNILNGSGHTPTVPDFPGEDW